MTKLLISVKNVEETATVLAVGADIIDLKDPEVGALGALNIELTAAILNQVKQSVLTGRTLTSATVGEGHLNVDDLVQDIKARSDLGVDIIKLAVSPLFDTTEFKRQVSTLTKNGVRLVCVFFADQPLDLDHLNLLKELGFYGAMLDTQSKSRALTEIKSTQYLTTFVAACKQNDLLCGLAGSLNHNNVVKLLDNCLMDFVGFRGGVCNQNQRNTPLVGERLQAIRELLLNHNKNTKLSGKGLDIALHS